ncbi:MAG: BP74-related protein [Planctomycetota bacterium]
MIATFRTSGIGTDGQPFDEAFRVWITNPATIDDLFEIQAGVNPNRFPAGKFLAGAGLDGHNAPWSWHLDNEDIAMVEVAMELCDGRPSFVEQDVASYIAIGRYCPWSAFLDSIEDHR